MKKNTKTSPAKADAETPKTRGKKERPLRILYCSPEVTPFSGTGGLGEVAGSLPAALNRLRSADIDCRVISPLYGTISQEYRRKMTFLGSAMIPVSWRRKYMGVFQLRQGGTTYYFIDNEEYFKRDRLYGHYDDCERYAFFCRAVFEAIPFLDFVPDILHANDWQTALVPVYQDAIYHRTFLTTVFTIHNVEYQGKYDPVVIGDVIGLPEGAEHLLMYDDCANLMKGGIDTANMVTTVSPTYAEELRDPFFAFGLDAVVRENAWKFRGILNGIDTHVYDPEHDPLIPANYSAKDMSGKAVCKEELQHALDLPHKNVPLVAVVSRLVPAKGIGLLQERLDGLLRARDFQLVVLGTGEEHYMNYFRGLQERFPNQVRSLLLFDSALSHRIYAGADLFLMPSRSEPCGLAQMIAMRYGTVPLVRGTGGLRDSVQDCTLGTGTGFVFDSFDGDSFQAAVGHALDLYGRREDWNALAAHDMRQDFRWHAASLQYLNMYRDAMDR